MPVYRFFCGVSAIILIFTASAQAHSCQGKILKDLEVQPFGRDGATYHYQKGEIISDVRAHRASFFGKPSYYVSRGIGPLPAKTVSLLNCHPVYHPSEGFFDPGYDLMPDEDEKEKKRFLGGEKPMAEYQKPIPVETVKQKG